MRVPALSEGRKARVEALVRPPSPAYALCLREDRSSPIDVDRALDQHRAYVEALRAAGLQVLSLSAEPSLPDACFVEDCAVVVGTLIIITRPGAPSRRPETATVEKFFGTPSRIERGTIDGGDVLVTDKAIFVGRSERTDDDGITSLRPLADRPVHSVPVGRLLHLKTGVTSVGNGVLLQRRGAFPRGTFQGFEVVEVDEPHGSTVLTLGRRALVSAAAPRTADLLAKRGFDVHSVEISEFHRGDAGVTCLSVIF